MTQTKYLAKDYDVFIGLDVDKASYSFTIQDHDIMNRSKKIPSESNNFFQYVRNHFPDKKVLCAYEAGPTGFELYDHLSQNNIDCLVISPLSMPKAPNQKVKNNRIDSQKITEELKAGKLKSIRVPQGPYRELRHLVNTREIYVHNRKIAKQRIKALLLYTHLHKDLKDTDQNWSNNYIQRLKELSCSSSVRHRLHMLLMDIDYARKQTTSILRQLRNFCKDHKQIKAFMTYLLSIPGIGFITASSLLARVGDPENLKNVRELGAFTGLVSSEKSTGNSIQQGSITHLGNRILRSLMVEAAWSAIRKDSELDQFYHRIKSRHHPKIAARKAIVAVARKLTTRIYCVLKEQRNYIVH